MKIRIDWSDGQYSLFASGGYEVDLPRWVVWMWLACGRVMRWIEDRYLVPASNKHHEERP